MLHTLPPVPSSIRFLTNAQAERVNSIYSTTSKDSCSTCHGTKTFRWYTEGRDIDSVEEFQCPCDDQWRLHRRFLHSGITESYQQLGWADFIELHDDAAAWAIDYIDNAEYAVGSGMSAIIWGTRGSGKSMLSNLMVKRLIADGIDCYTNTFSGILEAFSSGWKSEADRDWFNDRIRNAPLLLIDDVGRERNKGAGSLGENTLEEVLRYRTSRSMPTLITTNVPPEELSKGYGFHTMSLLSENAIDFRFEGEDRRVEIRKRKAAEYAARVTRPRMVE